VYSLSSGDGGFGHFLGYKTTIIFCGDFRGSLSRDILVLDHIVNTFLDQLFELHLLATDVIRQKSIFKILIDKIGQNR
jgi:hypothetical protein